MMVLKNQRNDLLVFWCECEFVIVITPTLLQMVDTHQFKLEHGSFKKIANADST
jgi:hypothetical protein